MKPIIYNAVKPVAGEVSSTLLANEIDNQLKGLFYSAGVEIRKCAGYDPIGLKLKSKAECAAEGKGSVPSTFM